MLSVVPVRVGIVIVCVLCLPRMCSSARNLALSKSTRQSSSNYSYRRNRGYTYHHSPRAVDGNSNTYSQTEHGSYQWWRVDLGRTYLISNVKLFPSYSSNYYAQLVTSKSSSPGSIFASYSHIRYPWISRHQFTGYLYSQQTVDLSVRARHVALCSTYRTAITILEMEIFAPDLNVDNNSLIMTPVSPSCISLQWSALSDVRSYQVNCTDQSTRNTSLSSISNICGYSPYTQVTCSVIPVRTQTQIADEYLAVAVNVTNFTNCSEPTKPDFSMIDRVQSHRGSQRDTRKIEVRITSRSTPHCDSIRSYNVRLYLTRNFTQIDSSSINSSGTVTVFENVKAVTNYTITMVAVNNRYKLSNVTSKTILTHELAPKAVENMTLTPESPYCVHLSWNAPTTPNGILLRYEYNCSGQSTSTTTIQVTNLTICGFTPYQNITCDLKAVNSYSDGEITRKSTFTLCIKPEKVSRIRVRQGSRDVDGHQKRNISISSIIGKPNCDRIIQCDVTLIHNANTTNRVKEFRFNPQSRTYPHTIYLSSDTTKFSALTGGETYTITYACKNNRYMISESTQLRLQADDLNPYDGVGDFQLRSNSSCVNMSWIPPQEPNGLITYYKYECLSNDVNSTGTVQENDLKSIPHTDKLQFLICGLPSESNVDCTLEAGNQAGLSPTARNSIYTKFNYITW